MNSDKPRIDASWIFCSHFLSVLIRVHLWLFGLLLLATLGFASPDNAGETVGPDDVPVVGRPVDLPFSEASGWFEVQVRAEPTTLQAEKPLTFTLSVRAVRPVRRPPERIDLRQLPDFAEQFYIEDAGEEPARPDDRTWEFAYRLKPRRVDVREIPSLPFVYFNPYILSASKGFQVLYTDPIPLHVLPPETVQVPVQGPEIAFVLAAGPGVLERQTPWSPPRLGTMLALLLAPPLGCFVWYLVWQRLYPDAARLANQRRSRAARHALEALHAAGRLDAESRAARTAAIVAGYLQQRLDLAIAEPTPREVAGLFAQHGCSSALTEQGVRFFDTCDSARFLPAAGETGVSLAALHDSAVRLILAVEAEGEEEKRRRGEEENNLSALISPFLLFSFSPFLLFSFSPFLLASQIPSTLSDREVLERAEAEFQEGVELRQDREQARPHFRSAADYFEELSQRGVRNAVLYRNLGNAYLLADDLPRAILWYRRGLRLAPNDVDLRDSLAEARQRVSYPAAGDLGRPRSDDRPPWLPHLRSSWLMLAATIFYALGCLSVTRWRMVRRGRLLNGGLLALLMAGVLAGWLMIRTKEQSNHEEHPLVVIARDGVQLRRGNGTAFPPRYAASVNRGVEGRRLFERGGWVQIELSGGEIGWAPREAVLVDGP
jgi:tetratricopeptide (TPR) repeat protein